ncbi:MAG: serine/threonine protein kinase [Pyrinomonadaceae bacterium]|nr:serine/threonine protein kinase [Pyrinomonadaceae bacterium]
MRYHEVMADGDWEKAKEIFLAALDEPEAVRAQFVSDRCGSNEVLIDEVRSLLASHDSAGDFIELSAFSVSSMVGDSSSIIGREFGPYKVLDEIGHGGMGAVFLAERFDGEFRHQVAIKIVRPGLDTANVRLRFVHERQILADLQHPYIARLLDGGTTSDGLPFLVMEYVDGIPITEFVKHLSLRERLILFQKVCEAVAFAHRRLIVHRDLKPSNIFVTADGRPKLLDFGIAKILENDGTQSQTLTSLGAFTPDYASPEQIRGGPITTASDIYSLGVVLYEMLAGASPYKFETRSPEEMIRVICESSPSTPQKHLLGDNTNNSRVRAGDLEGDVENIVLLALRKEPERRYASVEQFSDDIRRHLEGLPVIAREDTVAYRTAKFISRHRIGAAMAALLVLILIGGIVTTAWQARAARQQRDTAEAERAKAEKINQFLHEMLSYSNQSWNSVAGGQGRDVTINQMLDNIAPRLDTELADQPDVRAKIYRTIANAYNSQGRYPLGEKYLRSALAIQTELYGETHRETLITTDELGESLFQLGKLDEAKLLYERLISVLREGQTQGQFGGEMYLLAAALHGLGSTLVMRGEADEAIRILREASATIAGLDLAESERGLAAEIKLNLGAAILTKDDLGESELLLRESLTAFRSLPGDPRWETGVALTKLGECLVRQKNYAEAVGLLREGEVVYRNTIGEANNYLTRNLNYQAQAALEQASYADAERLSRTALAINDRSGLPADAVRARTLLTLGLALCKNKRTAAGHSFLVQSMELYKKANSAGPDVEIAMRSCEN